MATKVKKSIGHDRMTMKALFPNGDELNFNISRTRDTIKCSQLRSATPVTQAQWDTICRWLKWREGTENHMDRYVALLPNEPNPQDSYGELLRMAGNFDGSLVRVFLK